MVLDWNTNSLQPAETTLDGLCSETVIPALHLLSQGTRSHNSEDPLVFHWCWMLVRPGNDELQAAPRAQSTHSGKPKSNFTVSAECTAALTIQFSHSVLHQRLCHYHRAYAPNIYKQWAENQLKPHCKRSDLYFYILSIRCYFLMSFLPKSSCPLSNLQTTPLLFFHKRSYTAIALAKGHLCHTSVWPKIIRSPARSPLLWATVASWVIC